MEQLVKRWLYEAGDQLVASLSETLHIETKAHAADLVTEMDRATERLLSDRIKQQFPTDRILGEEGAGKDLTELNGRVWIIDPIDGTMNFVHQKRNFMISVALYVDGEGEYGWLYDPVLKEMYEAKRGNGATLNGERIPTVKDVPLNEAILGVNPTWLTPNKRIDYTKTAPLVRQVRGVRSYGCATLEMVYVAMNRTDAYMTMRLSAWDFAAGMVLLREVGAIVSDVEGNELPLLQVTSFLAAKPSVHRAIVAQLAGAVL